VNTSANRVDDSAIAWLHRVFKTDTTFDQFYECPKEFLTLDRKLAKSLSQVCPKYVRDKLTNKEVTYQNKGQQIKGLQILWMIAREFDVNMDLGFMYSIEDLSLMPFTSDKDLQGFLNKWDEILACIDIAKLEGPVLAQMFQKKLLTSQVMKTEVNHWRRLKVGHEDRTYEWLRDAVETHLRLEKEDRNQDTLQHAHRSGAKHKPAAPGKGEGKGKGKDKDKQKREGKGEGKGKGKGKGGGKSGASTPGGRKPPGQIPCRFLYGFGTCNKGKECDFAHRPPTKDEIREYGLFKQGEEGAPKPKGKGKGRCEPFFTSGSCRYGDKCVFSHSDKDKAKPKAKAKTKAKGKGKRAAPATEWDGEEEEWPEEE
jgi:hypothetical protein